MVSNTPDLEDILLQMRESFLETAHEKLDRSTELLGLLEQEVDKAEYVEELKREIHSLKGMGGTFQMPIVTKLCHQLETYMENVDEFQGGVLEDCNVYLDRIYNFIAQDKNNVNESHWLGNLPSNSSLVKTAKASQKSVLLISGNQDHEAYVQAVFSDAGFDSLRAGSVEKGFKICFQTVPQIVLCAQDVNGADGAELLRSLKAMKRLSKTKFAMVCPDRKAALGENLVGVNLLSEKNFENEIMNFVAIAVTA